ncbi:MAG: HIT domain-containing protein [Nitrospirae bacterium]|nr:HIT domain-containing protein [Nitrospirota bacterium]
MSCPFCNMRDDEIVLKNDLCYARFDKYPVNKGHLLIISFRHFDNYFDATEPQKYVPPRWQAGPGCIFYFCRYSPVIRPCNPFAVRSLRFGLSDRSHPP